jgi:ABC-type antimicrobial peptide transport system permease subunit
MSDARVSTTSLRGFWRSFRRSRMGMVGLFMLVGIVVIAVFAPVIAPYDPREVVRVSIDDIYARPNSEH